MSLIFAQPRHEYQSYCDFWNMVRFSGYPIIYQDEIDIHSDHTYILTGCDTSLSWINPRARIIFWLLEWYGDYAQKAGVAETWTSNRTFAERIGARYVPLGGRAELGTLDKYPPEYDFIHLSYAEIYRRGWLLGRMRESGYRIAPNGWGEQRRQAMMKSRALLHIHQQAAFPAIAPLRAVLAGAYGLPLIAENGWDTAPFTDIIYQGGYETMFTLVKLALRDERLQERGLALHHLLCEELRFDRVVEAHI